MHTCNEASYDVRVLQRNRAFVQPSHAVQSVAAGLVVHARFPRCLPKPAAAQEVEEVGEHDVSNTQPPCTS
jgi:hypothetical protein